jgi:transposase
MPWKEFSLMSLRKEFVSLAMVEGCNFSRLCDRLHISRKTSYKWVNRYLGEDESSHG